MPDPQLGFSGQATVLAASMSRRGKEPNRLDHSMMAPH
jgi:hypothetical protein